MHFRASFQIPNCRLSIVSRLTRFESLLRLCLPLCVCRLCTTCFAKVLIWTSLAVSFSLSLSRIYWVCVCAQTRNSSLLKDCIFDLVELFFWGTQIVFSYLLVFLNRNSTSFFWFCFWVFVKIFLSIWVFFNFSFIFLVTIVRSTNSTCICFHVSYFF